tara:strand:- start:11 stop:652 length:642 start_codon:yes stop_codon:yes gene_type:complete
MVGATNMTLDICSYGIWVKTNTGQNQTPLTLHQNFYFYMAMSGAKIVPYVKTPFGSINFATTDLKDDAWHFIAVTLAGGSGVSSTVNLYIDGVLDQTLTNTATYATVTDKKLKIGYYVNDAESWTGAYYAGNIDEISIWNTTLDADAITALYNSGVPIDLSSDSGSYDNSSDLIHWWRMGDKDTYPTIEDNVGSYDLTMTNMAEEDIEEDVPS